MKTDFCFRRLGKEKPHVFYSKYWTSWAAQQEGVVRIGDTPKAAFDTLRLAMIRGAKR